MEEYISKKETLELIRHWWKTTVYANKEPIVIKAINELPTIKADDGCCPECGANLEKIESEGYVNFADDLIPIVDEAESEDE